MVAEPCALSMSPREKPLYSWRLLLKASRSSRSRRSSLTSACTACALRDGAESCGLLQYAAPGYPGYPDLNIYRLTLSATIMQAHTAVTGMC